MSKLIVFSDIFGRVFKQDFDEFIKHYSIKYYLPSIKRKYQCFVGECNKECDYRVICVSNDSKNEVYLFLCAYHFNQIFWHGD